LPIELINLARLVDERLAGCFLQIVYLFAGNIIVKQASMCWQRAKQTGGG
jgi:hypothetical protein